MRIAYLADFNINTNLGVFNKVNHQIRNWQEAGHESQLFVISLHTEIEQASGINVITSKFISYLPVVLKQYANRIFCSKLVKQSIQNFDPDLIYYRQSIWYPGLCASLLLYPCVMEVNTDDEGEKEAHNYLARKYYFLGKYLIIKSINGLVSVSNEITDKYMQYDKPITTIANGIDTGLMINSTINSNSLRPQLIFATSARQYWQGIDKLVFLAKQCPGYDFHLVGEVVQHIPSNMICYGYIPHHELAMLYRKMDFGIGTLALHRKKMYEASPLKTREYALYGLPMIIGFNDTDLDGQDFVLNIGNYENNVIDNISKICDFVEKWKNKQVDQNKIVEKLSNKTKETKRLAFFEQVLNTVSPEQD